MLAAIIVYHFIISYIIMFLVNGLSTCRYPEIGLPQVSMPCNTKSWSRDLDVLGVLLFLRKPLWRYTTWWYPNSGIWRHVFRHFAEHAIWHLFWHSIWHSIWHIFRHPFWNSIWNISDIWHIFCHYIWQSQSIWHILFLQSIWHSISYTFCQSI